MVLFKFKNRIKFKYKQENLLKQSRGARAAFPRTGAAMLLENFPARSISPGRYSGQIDPLIKKTLDRYRRSQTVFNLLQSTIDN